MPGLSSHGDTPGLSNPRGHVELSSWGSPGHLVTSTDQATVAADDFAAAPNDGKMMDVIARSPHATDAMSDRAKGRRGQTSPGESPRHSPGVGGGGGGGGVTTPGREARRAMAAALGRPSPSASSPGGSIQFAAAYVEHISPGLENMEMRLGPKASARSPGGVKAEAKRTAADPASLPVGSRAQLNQYREKLAKDLERRELSVRQDHPGAPTKQHRVSPIQEEESASTPPITTDMSTASTESAKTVRGGAPTPNITARTPSYPFPRMGSNAGLPLATSRAFDTPSQPGGTPVDKLLSGPSTPASAMTFQPTGFGEHLENMAFPSPNLYDLSLMLQAEPGLGAWWNAVVQIMTEVYRAERVTLAVPADTTDIQNVPWGQKATFSVSGGDELSLGYMGRGSSLIPSSAGDVTEEPAMISEARARPSLQSRHSFTTYEEAKERGSRGETTAISRRPAALPRSKSYFPTSQPADDVPPATPTTPFSPNHPELNRAALDELNADGVVQQHIPSWEAQDRREVQGRLLPVLQALDYEADPLIDHLGVTRVLERGKVIALTRSYPYLDNTEKEAATPQTPAARPPAELTRKRSMKMKSDAPSKLSTMFGGGPSRASRGSSTKTPRLGGRLDDDIPTPPTPKYEEYEQAPPSPWSQSPAPSPAVRTDVKENPFFTDAVVDEESFNPGPSAQDYSTLQQAPEAIGVDNSWTVLHIPLKHVLLSKPTVPGFKLDSAAVHQRAGMSRGAKRNKESSLQHPAGMKSPSQESLRPDPQPPIAILSILSPIIPYPSSLRHSLEHLAPHLATSFSLNRHYTNLETELAGLQRRRPQTAGFGAIGPDGKPLLDALTLANLGYMTSEDAASQRSMAGSITSPSDYSGPTRSTAGSPGGTPIWDPAALGLMVEGKRNAGTSPAPMGAAEGYFGSNPRSSLGRIDTTSPAGVQRMPKLGSPSEKRSARLSTGKLAPSAPDAKPPAPELGEGSSRLAPESPSTLAPQRRVEQKDAPPHTVLHSYGADFSSTFQSLPGSSAVGTKTWAPNIAISRSGSVSTSHADMPPPSDRLKGLILDSLPTHVFVALPQNGEIVWVNSRYLVYRGQTVSDLASDAWSSIHPEDRDEHLRAWAHSLKTGEQFSRVVRIRRFDGAYRWFYARAVASRDKRGVIMQFLGSYMDIHDQRIAEIRAARQEEIEASEAKHRLLANLIPQIIFTATEEDGITFANEQWLTYTGQGFDDSLGLGFMDFVHPEDLAKCRIPPHRPSTPLPRSKDRFGHVVDSTLGETLRVPEKLAASTNRAIATTLSRNNSSSSSGSSFEALTGDLPELARKGIIKVSTDSSGQLSYTTEVRLRSKTGEYRWHLIRCVEILADKISLGGGASSYFGSATDINDHKLLETKLKEAMDSKGRFLSNMSHEIRTPLIGISGMVSFLQDTTLNEEQRDYTNTIQTSANSLLMIINDILDLSKIDAGMMKLTHEWFHTRSLIEDVNELVSTMAIAKRLELNYMMDDDVPTWVKGDKVRIRQVLLNVIGNAIKFTSEGEVFSTCKVYRGGSEVRVEESDYDTGSTIMLEFSISDTGRGFTKEEAELIFKPFSQIDESSTRQHGGSGLGLVISRQLVELHGGQMSGTAVRGKGSTFTFSARFGLPTAEDHPDTSIPLPEQSQIPDEISPRNLQRYAPLRTPLTPQTPAPIMAGYGATTTTITTKTTAGTKPTTPGTAPTPPEAGGPGPAAVATSPAMVSSPGVASSGSSAPSVQSARSTLATTADHSSAGSSAVGGHPQFANFGEAVRTAAPDPRNMKLEMPSEKNSPGSTPTPETSRESLETAVPVVAAADDDDDKLAALREATAVTADFRPPMYSIVVVCPQRHSREATERHIEMTLPKDVPHQITSVETAEAAEALLGGEDPVIFTHVVLNLPSPQDIARLVDAAMPAVVSARTAVIVLSDSVQRQALMKAATASSSLGVKSAASTRAGRLAELLAEKKVTFVNKPIKPSRFAAVFDPDQRRDHSIDQNRSTARRMLESQKQTYLRATQRMGNKGYRVLLVEDNPLNQKVLRQFLGKVGVDVDIASDGVECTDKVFSHPVGFYRLVLCDLHMPRKDGYQACREIREWETTVGRERMPMIALSANVMSDVQDKCVSAGFDDYVTKPVDFVDLSSAMSKYF